MLSDVCLSVAYIGPKSRTERPSKTKIGTEVGHVIRDSDTTFNDKGQGHRGRGILWRPPTYSLLLSADADTCGFDNIHSIPPLPITTEALPMPTAKAAAATASAASTKTTYAPVSSSPETFSVCSSTALRAQCDRGCFYRLIDICITEDRPGMKLPCSNGPVKTKPELLCPRP